MRDYNVYLMMSMGMPWHMRDCDVYPVMSLGHPTTSNGIQQYPTTCPSVTCIQGHPSTSNDTQRSNDMQRHPATSNNLQQVLGPRHPSVGCNASSNNIQQRAQCDLHPNNIQRFAPVVQLAFSEVVSCHVGAATCCPSSTGRT